MAAGIYSLGVAGQDKQMASLDRKFHLQLLHFSGNAMLIRLSDNYRILGKVIRVGRDQQEVRDEHLAILRAVEANLPHEAEHLVREHIRTGEKSVEQQIESGTFTHSLVL